MQVSSGVQGPQHSQQNASMHKRQRMRRSTVWQWGFVQIGYRTKGRVCMCLQAWIWGRTYPELSRRMRASR
jgi:hypothetical protein